MKDERGSTVSYFLPDDDDVGSEVDQGWPWQRLSGEPLRRNPCI